MTSRIALGLAIALLAPGCADAAAQSAVKTQAASDMRCPEETLKVAQIEGSSDGGTLHARNGTMWTPRAYHVAGCGKQLTYICDDWNSYDQTPVCHTE